MTCSWNTLMFLNELMYIFRLFSSIQRRFGTYRRRIIAKSGKSEKGQIAVNSGISKSIQISLPGYSYEKASSGARSISSRGVERMSRPCMFMPAGPLLSNISMFSRSHFTDTRQIIDPVRLQFDQEIHEHVGSGKGVRAGTVMVDQVN